MGKNKKSTVTINDCVYGKENVELDSNEEYYVYHWIMEAYRAGIIKEYEYQPKEFLLTDKFKYVPAFGNPKKKEKHLLADHVYTADFRIVFNKSFGEKLSEYFKIPIEAIDANGNAVVYIDVKGGFMRNNSGRSFSINQKLVYEKYKIFVQKLIPEDLFKKLGCPKELFMTRKTHKVSKKFSIFKSIEEIFVNKYDSETK